MADSLTPQVPQTPVNVLYIVVGTIAGLAVIGLLAILAIIILHIAPDPHLLAALLNTESTLIGLLGGLLINTRQNATPPEAK
jgi:hypothetical protein